MSNNKKIYNKNNTQRKDFVQNKPKKELKKLDKALFWLLILMFVFWTVGSTLAIINTFKGGLKTASAQSYEQFDPYSSDQANLFNNFAYSDTESQIYLNSQTSELSFESQPYLTTVNTSFSYTLPNITHLRFLYFPLKANTDYTISLNIHSGSPSIVQLVRPTSSSDFYQSFKSNSGERFQVSYFADVYDKSFSFNSGDITDYFIFFGIPGNVSSFSFTCYVHLGFNTTYQYQPYLPALLDSAYNDGFYFGSSVSTSSIFLNSTLSGTAFITDNISNPIEFENISPNYILNGISFLNLHNYLLSLIPSNSTLSSISITLNFSRPLVFQPSTVFQFSGNFASLFYQFDLNLRDSSNNLRKISLGSNVVEVAEGVYYNVIDFNKSDDLDLLSTYTISSFTFSSQQINQNILDSLFLTIPDTLYYNGYNVGYQEGIDVGQSEGYQQGKDEFYNSRYQLGYQNGLNVGYEEGVQSANDYTFFSLISAVVDAPLQAVRGMLNFDLLGFNMLNFFYALVTLALIIIFTRMALW